MASITAGDTVTLNQDYYEMRKGDRAVVEVVEEDAYYLDFVGEENTSFWVANHAVRKEN